MLNFCQCYPQVVEQILSLPDLYKKMNTHFKMPLLFAKCISKDNDLREYFNQIDPTFNKKSLFILEKVNAFLDARNKVSLKM